MRHDKSKTLVTVFVTTTLAGCGSPQRPPSQPTPEAASERTASADTQQEAQPSAAAGAPASASAKAAQSDGPTGNQFVLKDDPGAREAQGAHASKIKATRTEAAMKFFVVDKDKGPVEGIVISLTGADGKKYYTEETDSQGYAEVLVPVGQKYELVYLSLGRKDIAATVPVTDEPNQNVKLTLRYKRHVSPTPPEGGTSGAARFVLKGVTFDTGKATLRPESFPRLDSIVEYMTHKPHSRIEISGHTDNAGNPKANQVLSDKRAKAVRDYVVSKGIDGGRIQAVGYGDQRPIESNDTEAGRQENRRIEATEL